MIWTKQAIAYLRANWETTTARDIADDLTTRTGDYCTRGAVIGKAHRLDLPIKSPGNRWTKIQLRSRGRPRLPKPFPKRVCATCGKEYQPIKYLQKFCTKACNPKYHNKDKDWHRDRDPQTEWRNTGPGLRPGQMIPHPPCRFEDDPRVR